MILKENNKTNKTTLSNFKEERKRKKKEKEKMDPSIIIDLAAEEEMFEAQEEHRIRNEKYGKPTGDVDQIIDLDDEEKKEQRPVDHLRSLSLPIQRAPGRVIMTRRMTRSSAKSAQQ